MAPPSAEKNARSIITLDPDGDCLLSIINRNKVTRFLVSSSVLSLASPAFRSYFNSSAPASKPHEFTIMAPEKYDDLSLGLLMQICHFQRASPIPFVPLERLYNLAVTAYRFCLVTPVEPWVTIWTTPLICDLAFKKPNEIDMWLYIASVFNQEQMFQRVTQKAILSYTSEFLDKVDSGSLHRAVVDEIREIRITAIGKLIALGRSLVDKVLTPDSICTQPEMAAQCDAILLGSVLKSVKSLKIYPIAQVAPYPGTTVEELSSALMSLSFFCFDGHKQTCQIVVKKESEYIRGAIQQELSLLVGLDIRNFPVTWGDTPELPIALNPEPVTRIRAADAEGTVTSAANVATRIEGDSAIKVGRPSGAGTAGPRVSFSETISSDRVAGSGVTSPSVIVLRPRLPTAVLATTLRTRSYHPTRHGNGNGLKDTGVGEESQTCPRFFSREKALANFNGNPSLTERKHTNSERVSRGNHASKVSEAHGMLQSNRPVVTDARDDRVYQNAQVKRLARLFPAIKNEDLIEALEYNNWDAQTASLYLSGACILPTRVVQATESNSSAPRAGGAGVTIELPVTAPPVNGEPPSPPPSVTPAPNANSNQIQPLDPTKFPHAVQACVAEPTVETNRAPDVAKVPKVLEINKAQPKPKYEPNWTVGEHNAIGKEMILEKNSVLLRHIVFKFPHAEPKALLTYLFRAGWNLNVAVSAIEKAGLTGEPMEKQENEQQGGLL